MYPYILGNSYVFMMVIGVLLSLLILVIFLSKKFHFSLLEIVDILIVSIIAIGVGVIFSILFENLYEWIEKGKIVWTWGMTFFGGIFGGVFAFLIMYRLFYLKRHDDKFSVIFQLAPIVVLIAHGFGRIGCFLSGCCYGKETNSVIGVILNYGEGAGVKRIPVQIIEALFLFLMALILIVLTIKNISKFNVIIYLICYSIFRFVIEFYRGDYRGQIVGLLSPSQIWCLVLFACGIALIFTQNMLIFKRKRYEN